MIDVNKAFDIGESGIVLTDNDGNPTLYITSGSGSPVGQQAPVPTLYIEDGGTLWLKDGPTVNDWTENPGGGSVGSVGGHSANYVFTPGNEVGGCDANGN